uniref:Uncharacterized protein n=1 Tax=Leersia perrieri TaxID=77586 RepID=A0A0D9WNL1_9ORYZ
MAANEPIKEPEIRSQKESNCWQIASQFALAFPLCAKYTIAAAADAPAVTRASIAFTRITGNECGLGRLMLEQVAVQDVCWVCGLFTPVDYWISTVMGLAYVMAMRLIMQEPSTER